MTTSNQSEPPDDRLQREVDEILKQARSRPISFQERVEQKRNAMRHQQKSSKPAMRQIVNTARRIFLKVPIVTALALAVVAAYLAPEYDMLAFAFALAAIVMVFVPFAARGSTSSPANQTRWRGRVVSNLPPAHGNQPQSWVDHIKRRFNR